jgi:glycosyltransferase involved in cell wall biosynthesis
MHMQIALIGSARFGTDEPHAGGLEAHVATLSRHLEDRGHRVETLPVSGASFAPSSTARRDVTSGAAAVIAEHHTYLGCMLDLQDRDIDVLHNHSLHYLPIAMAPTLQPPIVTTLHSPPTEWLESAFRLALQSLGPVVSVSEANARQWSDTLPSCGVVPNGVDLARFVPGPGGGGYAVWYGRIVPEKGVGDAIAAARGADMPLRIAGPIHDPDCFAEEVRPHLGADVSYEGHLDADGLNELVGSAEVTVVAPRWEEPYGLVVAESLAMGTPVAATRRGGIPEILTEETGRISSDGGADALAEAIVQARVLDRGACRRRAEDHCNVEVMVDRYEAIYREAVAGR